MTISFHRPLLALLALAPFATAEPVTLDGKIRPLLKEFCFDCHNPDKAKGDLNLVPIAANPKLDEHREIWEKVVELIESREMPPSKKPQPTDEQRDLMLHFIDGQLSKLDCSKVNQPGRVTIRRLNKEEYRNTIRDLLRVEYQPEDFPNDEVGYGFDNIGDVLSLSPLLMEKFITAAEEIAERAIKLDATGNLPESHQQLITRMPNPGEEHAVAMEVMNRFAKRAYRRPVSDAEVARLAGFVDLALKNGGSFLEGIRAGVQAGLCSPHFLFRWELDPQAPQPGEVRDLGDYEVASRLSYFLWSSMPDSELFALAEKGELRKNGNLEKQVVRMMRDWRSFAFVQNFAGQWLQIRNIWEASIDPDTFPKWDDSLKGAMKEETEQFFTAIMKEDRPVTDLLDADFTFLNEKLARYYGIEGVKGDKMQRVTLPKDSPRGGVLTQGSVLLSTSTPTRTSPVTRGKWILEQILGTPPPPAPPDVPPLPEQRTVDQSASLRQRFEVHRANADCAGCHAKMDPLGFALENFDATGAWRDQDGKFPIDASGELANGTKFNGARELKQVLKSNKAFVRSLARNLMIYGLGRGLEYPDKCAVDAALTQAAQHGNKFSALVTAIVTSEPFLKRQSEVAKN